MVEIFAYRDRLLSSLPPVGLVFPSAGRIESALTAELAFFDSASVDGGCDFSHPVCVLSAG